MNAKEQKAQDWFLQNYHTPMDSFLAKYGVPVLHGVHDDGQEEWEDIPIGKILEAYHKHKMREIANEVYELIPVGEIDAFTAIQAIAKIHEHLKQKI